MSAGLKSPVETERKKRMFRALLLVSLLLLKIGIFTKAADLAKAGNFWPEPDCPWPAPPDCEC
jgi:hypothetical protein